MSSKQLQSEKSELRIVLLGYTGDGKSSVGNAILGSEVFLAQSSPESVTNECKMERRELDGQTVAVVDTPGLFHTKMKEAELAKAILGFVPNVKPGPHVLLLVLKMGASDENEKMLQIFREVFKDSKNHTIVLFTHGDKCNIDDYLSGNSDLKELISQCSRNYHVFNFKDQKDAQVTDLMQKIKEVVLQNEGNCYPNEKFEKAEKPLKEAMKCPKVKNWSRFVREANNKLQAPMEVLLQGEANDVIRNL